MSLKSIAFAALAATASLVPVELAAEAHDETAAPATDEQHRAIARLVEVWGFIKYHHPDAREGRIAMDPHFFALYPRMRAAGSVEEGDAILADWLAGLGPGAPCDPCASDPDASEIALATDTPRWLAGLPANLSAPLRAIYENRSGARGNFLIRPKPGTGNPIYANEPDYSATRRLDEEAVHMLTLARQWNLLRYWFPYRDVMDAEPHSFLVETVADFLAAEDETGRQRARRRLGVRSNDTHVGFTGYSGSASPAGECALPYSLRFIGGDLVVDGVVAPDNAVLRRGDVITSLDGRAVGEMVAEYAPLIASSNSDALGRRLAGVLIRGECGDRPVTLTRGGEAMTIEVPRVPGREAARIPYYSRERQGEVIQSLGNGVTYAAVPKLKLTHIPELVERANAGTGLVLDIRGYRDDFTVFALGGAMVDEATPFVRFSIPDYATPGRFTWTRNLELTPDDAGRLITVPSVLLMDETAISSSEYHAMAWRAAGATVIGSTTAGADGDVSALPLPDGVTMYYTGIGVFYPDGSPTQRIGIVPDIEVRPTLEGIAAGRDEVLDAALDHLATLP